MPKKLTESNEIEENEIEETEEIEEVENTTAKGKKKDNLFPPQPKHQQKTENFGSQLAEALKPIQEELKSMKDQLEEFRPKPIEPNPEPPTKSYRIFDEFDPTL